MLGRPLRRCPLEGLIWSKALSREQYLHDLERLATSMPGCPPHGTMTPDDIAIWTEAIGKKG